MKRAVIVHCWGGNSNYAWYPSAKKNLEAKGYQVSIPDMPDPDMPTQAKWLTYLNGVVGMPDDELVLIGHSIGTVTILRYLESLPAGTKINKVILVAAFDKPLNEKQNSFFGLPFDYEKIKNSVKSGIVVINSDNDPYVDVSFNEQLENSLGAKLIVKKGAKHMSGPVDDPESCTSLTEVIENIS